MLCKVGVMQVRRFDVRRFDASQVQYTSQGYLRVPGAITSVGVFPYQRADGSIIHELRPADEVFKADSLASFQSLPITNNHPSVMLDSVNTKQYQVGYGAENIVREDTVGLNTLTVTDAASIADIKAGRRRDISPGYFVKLDMTPGMWNPKTGEYGPHIKVGIHYDAIQREIHGNHIAIVDHGRQGKNVALRLDSISIKLDASDGISFDEAQDSLNFKPTQEGTRVTKIKIDGVELEVSEAVAVAFNAAQTKTDKALSDEKARVDALTKEVSGLQGKFDAATAEVTKLQAQRVDSKVIVALAKQRNDVVSLAGKILPKEVLAKIDTMEVFDIQKAILVAQVPDLKLDGKDEAYIVSAFDVAAIEVAKRKDTTELHRATKDAVLGDESEDLDKVRKDANDKKNGKKVKE